MLVALLLTACGGSGTSVSDPPPNKSGSSAPSFGYTLSAAALTPASVTAGNAASAAITLTPTQGSGDTEAVTLSCKVVSGGVPSPACSFKPSVVALSGAAGGTSLLTVSSTSAVPGGPYSILVTATDASGLAPSNGPQTLPLTIAAVIQHIVIIFQENRTPDNLFQDPVLISRGADIASSGKNSLGQVIALTPIDLGWSGPSPQNYDLAHEHGDFVIMYHYGKMDGANWIACWTGKATSCPANPQYKYVMPADVQPYFSLAEQYTFADRMFQTNQGPSFPAHQFIISGTSAPTATSPLFASENPSIEGGCIAPANSVVPLINAQGGGEYSQPPMYPCFEHPTLTDLLETHGITWRYYTPTAGSIWTGPVAIQHIGQQQTIGGKLTCTGPEWTANVVIPQTKVLSDIADGQLAQVTWIIPDGRYSDHAMVNDGSGPAWVASIVNAIGNSAYWSNTAIIITWDDWGGWYDHVAPTVVNDGSSWGSGYVYGFRVPLIFVSPYAKSAYISHATHDFGSILRFIEVTFGLPSLGYADTRADALADCYNLTQAPLTFHTIAAPLGPGHFINDTRPPVHPDDD